MRILLGIILALSVSLACDRPYEEVGGYASGGVVGGNAYKIPQQPQQQPIVLNVTVHEDGSVEVDQKGITGDIKKYIDVTVDRKIANNKRSGGMLG